MPYIAIHRWNETVGMKVLGMSDAPTSPISSLVPASRISKDQAPPLSLSLWFLESVDRGADALFPSLFFFLRELFQSVELTACNSS